MNHRLPLVLFTLMIPAVQASPTGLAVSPDGTRLYVAMESPAAIVTVDAAQAKVVATWPLPQAARGVAVAPDGARLYVPAGMAPGSLLTVDVATGAVAGTQPGGHSPTHATVSPDGGTLWICNLFENRVDVLRSGQPGAAGQFPTVREPVSSAVRPDGRALFVTNLLPAGAANTGDIGSEISVFDTASGDGTHLRLPNGATDARAIAVSPDGRFAYAAHTLARYALPTTQLDRGWMNTSALTLIDAANPKILTTLLLDDIDRGAANPSAIAISADGRTLAVAHAGTHEVSLIDRAALHERIDRAARGEAVTSVTRSLSDIPNDLSFLHGIRQRVKLSGNGPRALVPLKDGFAAACYFSQTLHLIRTDAQRKVTLTDLALAPGAAETAARAGERIFFDATRCFQHWQSCATCHPYGRNDALNWDLLNDGMGNPKQSKSLLRSIQTPPAMISGIRPRAEIAIRTGVRYILFATIDEAEAGQIEAYLTEMKPIPSPVLVNGQLSPAALRGREVFQLAGCSNCHSGPDFTDGKAYDVGTGTGREANKAWDTPALTEIWRTAPYLYDGRAATLEDVIGPHNPNDAHGNTSTLTPEQRKDLIEYVKSL